jgi:molybdopterin converting factor small subunit
MYGLSGDEFQKALEKGRIGAEAVQVAIINLTNAGGKYANGAIAQSDTLNGKLSTLQDSFQQLARNIGTFFEPVFKFLIDGINAFLDRVNNGLRASAQLQANEQAATRTRSKFGLIRQINPFDKEAQEYEARLQKSIFKSLTSQGGAGSAPSAPASTAVPALLGATGGGTGRKGKTDAERAAEKAAREAARALEIQKQQLKAADDQNFALLNRLAILQETEAVAKRELELDVRLNEIAREYDELKTNAKSNDELILINANSVLEKKAAELEAEREINDLIAERVRLMAQLTQEAMQPTVYNELETQDAALQSILEKYPAIGAAADAAATMATSGIQAMIAGTKSAEQVFVEFLSSIADALIDTAKQMIAQYIAIGIARMFAGIGGGGGGGDFAASGPLAAVGNVGPAMNFNPVGANPVGAFAFAEGGFVTGPTNAIIGEGGEPEYIIPASKMSAAMKRYGGGARGSAVIPTSGDTSEAGGNATAVNGAIDVRYTVERINSVDYVTADQFQQGMQQAAMQGAQRGEQMVLRKLQQSPSTRRRVGVS